MGKTQEEVITEILESDIWGKVEECGVAQNNIYYVVAQQGSGYVVPVWEHTILSANAIKMGIVKGEYRYFDEIAKDVVLFELTIKRKEKLEKNLSDIWAKIEEIKTNGKISLTEYFGEFSPPEERDHKIRNGIYLSHNSGQLGILIHQGIAKNFLTEMAMEMGKQIDDYYFYDTTTSMVVVFELGRVFEEVADIAPDKKILFKTLNENFMIYVMKFNQAVTKSDQIPTT